MIGRYQLVPAQSGYFIMDTTSGHTWFRAGETWIDLGAPTTQSDK